MTSAHAFGILAAVGVCQPFSCGPTNHACERHYWLTPQAGGKVDKERFAQFGRAMHQLGINTIRACSPEARGRSERAFGMHQARPPKKLALAKITDKAAANRNLKRRNRRSFNAEFAVSAAEPGSACMPRIGGEFKDILCEQFARTIGRDNCVHFDRLALPRRLTATAAIASKRRCGCIATATGKWPCSTAPAAWLTIKLPARRSNPG